MINLNLCKEVYHIITDKYNDNVICCAITEVVLCH